MEVFFLFWVTEVFLLRKAKFKAASNPPQFFGLKIFLLNAGSYKMLPTTHLLGCFTVTEFIILTGKQSLGCFKIIPKLFWENNSREKKLSLRKETEPRYYFSHSGDERDVSRVSSLPSTVLLNADDEIYSLPESPGLLTLNCILGSGRME